MTPYKIPEHYKPSNICPFCKATDLFITGGKFNKDKSYYSIVNHCNKCEAVWVDLYMYIATKVKEK